MYLQAVAKILQNKIFLAQKQVYVNENTHVIKIVKIENEFFV